MANLLLKMLAKKQTPILSLTEQVIGIADMGEIWSVVEKCDTTNLVTLSIIIIISNSKTTITLSNPCSTSVRLCTWVFLGIHVF